MLSIQRFRRDCLGRARWLPDDRSAQTTPVHFAPAVLLPRECVRRDGRGVVIVVCSRYTGNKVCHEIGQDNKM